MSGEILNLRRARKARARAEARAAADANAARSGEPKADRAVREAEAARSARALDGHVRNAPPPGDSTDGG